MKTKSSPLFCEYLVEATRDMFWGAGLSPHLCMFNDQRVEAYVIMRENDEDKNANRLYFDLPSSIYYNNWARNKTSKTSCWENELKEQLKKIRKMHKPNFVLMGNSGTGNQYIYN